MSGSCCSNALNAQAGSLATHLLALGHVLPIIDQQYLQNVRNVDLDFRSFEVLLCLQTKRRRGPRQRRTRDRPPSGEPVCWSTTDQERETHVVLSRSLPSAALASRRRRCGPLLLALVARPAHALPAAGRSARSARARGSGLSSCCRSLGSIDHLLLLQEAGVVELEQPRLRDPFVPAGQRARAAPTRIDQA